jgi:hypothetical protein
VIKDVPRADLHSERHATSLSKMLFLKGVKDFALTSPLHEFHCYQAAKYLLVTPHMMQIIRCRRLIVPK